MKRECHKLCIDKFEGVRGRPLYGFGERLCKECDFVFRNFEGAFCPCCGADLKFTRNEEFYKEEHYSESFLAELERRKKRQCSWCKSFISKYAEHRIHGDPKSPDATISFYQEWRTDKLGNQVCHDCWMTGNSIDSFDVRLATFSMKLAELALSIPSGFNERISQVLKLYPVPKKENPFLTLVSE